MFSYNWRTGYPIKKFDIAKNHVYYIVLYYNLKILNFFIFIFLIFFLKKRPKYGIKSQFQNGGGLVILRKFF